MGAIFISVRTSSQRLPKKCLRKIGDKTAIELVIERVKRSWKAEKVILCTTRLPEDNLLCGLALRQGIPYFRGSSEDKLDRWRGAALVFGVDFFVTADGDDLLCDPELIDLAFDQYERTNADFIEAKNVPCGAFTYGIKTKALNRVCKIKDSKDTEMMVPYFTTTGLFHVEQLMDVPEILQRPEIRLTMDYEDDLKFFQNVYGHFLDEAVSGFKGFIFSDNPTNFTLRDVIKYLDANPEVIEINKHCQDLYLSNQKKMTRIALKYESLPVCR